MGTYGSVGALGGNTQGHLARPQFLPPLSRSGEGDRCAKRNTANLLPHCRLPHAEFCANLLWDDPTVIFCLALRKNHDPGPRHLHGAENRKFRSWRMTKNEPSER